MTMTMTKAERDEYLAIRKQAGLQIDPETAVCTWWWADELDPYGIGANEMAEYCSSINRCYFVRAPSSNVWVHDRDLPETTYEALRKRGEREELAERQSESGRAERQRSESEQRRRIRHLHPR